MDNRGLNDNQVTVHLGISVGTIGKSRKQNRDLSKKTIELILNFYKDLNKVWLITGNGEMLNPQEKHVLVLENEDKKILQYFMEENAEYRKTIGFQAESINKMQDQIIELQRKLDEKGNASVAPGADAACVIAG